MILRLERRSQRSTLMALLSPVLAIAVTLALGAVMFAGLGFDPAEALYMYFVEPLTSVWSVEEVIVKAAPLIIIGVGLAVCYTANVWNIGAEGQLTIGALVGAAIPIYFPDWQSPLVLVLMLALGAAGGALFAAIPAFLKNRFSANEILTSLMLVYVAQLLLDWLVRGPWRDPDGYNFPQSIPFEGWQLLPLLGEGRVHIGAVFAVAAVIVVAFMMGRTLRGFEIRVVGTSPRAAAFAGFRGKRVILFCFMLSGALAGLAGICEVAGPNGELQPNISPGYGFTAIIVAFLGRLNPIGVLFAGVLLAISYMGGEGVQVELGISDKTTRVVGTSPRAAAFAGFRGKRVILFCFMLSGALAGLAGICEVAGPNGELQPNISPGYGFTAIIVAFLGRLNPIGVLFAGVLLAISYMGGEGVQVELGISDKTTQVFQGMLLFLILACDTLIRYRIRLVHT